MMPEFFVIPLIVMGGPVLIAVILLRYRTQLTKARYQTLLQLAEKGVELPPALFVEPQSGFSERRRALVLISIGLGLMAMFIALPFKLDSGVSVASLWGLGLLPLMTGLGYLASWWLNWRDGTRD
ncbi:MAG TPA: DUF6249 domain-containing protein [Rhizomicrobium sp.]|nr:DUF6249 domain-containing protein [Rhizomicrobium sp.]